MSREIPLLARDGSVKAVTTVSDEDYERVTAAGPWHLSQGYVTKTVGLHRFVMLGTDLNQPVKVDHKDRDPLNNTRENLRSLDDAGSVQNRGTWGASMYRGVYRKGKRWAAAGKVGGVRHFLGTFDTEIEAAEVAAAWRQEHLPYAQEEVA